MSGALTFTIFAAKKLSVQRKMLIRERWLASNERASMFGGIRQLHRRLTWARAASFAAVLIGLVGAFAPFQASAMPQAAAAFCAAYPDDKVCASGAAPCDATGPARWPNLVRLRRHPDRRR